MDSSLTRATPEEKSVLTADATVSFLFANLFGTGVFIMAVMAIAVPHVLLWGGMADFFGAGRAFWLGLLVALPIHEGLHGIGFHLGGAGWKGVKYGFAWSKLMPYAHCRVPLTARSYRWACALPGVALGVLPALVGITFGWGQWMLFGVVMLGLAGGDASVLWAIRCVPGESQIIDHPTEVGCRVLLAPVPERGAASGAASGFPL